MLKFSFSRGSVPGIGLGAFGATCLALFFLISPTGHAAPQKLIVHDQAGSGTSSRTGPILNNLSYIDSLPFDGLTLNIPATWNLLAPGNVANYNDIYTNWLGPLKGKLHNVTHNYVKIVARKSADPFDDWTQTINNWVTLARAASDAGLEGIWFDNEEYYEQMWNYPSDVKYPSKTLSEYQEQYRLRGQQVMQAIMAQWSQAKVLHAHGPYVSDSRTPHSVTLDQISSSDNDLRGYFFAGMCSVGPGQVIDGGEVYQYRSLGDFSNSRTWRKTSLPDLSPNTLIPGSLKSAWLSYSNIAFGTYDQQWRSDYSMNQSIFQTVIANGLNQTDGIVWTYAEGHDYLTPGSVTQDWINAVWNARSAAGIPAPGASGNPSPTPSPSATPPPGGLTVSNVQVASITQTTAVISWNVSPAATGQVEYGTSSAYGSFTSLETNHLTFHRQNVSGLRAGTLYHYRVRGTDAQGNSVPLVDRTFTTSR